jgi:hypothetical protein
MQLRKTSAFALYIGSYVPLALVMLVQDVDLSATHRGICPASAWFGPHCTLPLQHPWWSLGLVIASVACLFMTVWTLNAVATPRQVNLLEAKHIPADLINYAMPYVVSFMGLEFSSTTRLLGFGVFFVWIFWITYRSGQIVMNPILIVFGWRLYEVKYSFIGSERARIGRALCRGELEPGKVYRRGVMQDVMVMRDLEEESSDG